MRSWKRKSADTNYEGEDNRNRLCHEDDEGIFIKLLFDAMWTGEWMVASLAERCYNVQQIVNIPLLNHRFRRGLIIHASPMLTACVSFDTTLSSYQPLWVLHQPRLSPGDSPRFLNRVKTGCARCGVNNVPKVWKKVKRKKGFQYSALTQSYKNYLLSELHKDFVVEVTFGATTKYHRNQLELPKSQINDALVVRGSDFQNASMVYT